MSDRTEAPDTVRAVVDCIAGAAEGAERVTLEDIVDALGPASFPPLLMAPALAVVTPLSGIPLFSSICGTLIVLISGQMALGRRTLWLPDWLLRRSLPGDRLRRAAAWLEGPADWLDRRTGPRLRFLVAPPADRLVHLVCLICGAGMPMAELIPFTSSILGAAVLVLSMALLVKDGLVAVLGLGIIALAIRVGMIAL